MIQDLRFAVRLLVKDRWFTLIAVLALALGIGMNATVFTFVNAVLLRGLPYPDQGRILHIILRNATTGEEGPVSYPDFLDWKTRATSFSGLAAFRVGTLNLSDGGRPPERAAGGWITPNSFSLLGQPMHLGRDFRPEEQSPAADPVVIVSYDIWQTRYGARPPDPPAHDQGQRGCVSVIGVPAGVKFPQNADVRRPLVTEASTERRSHPRGVRTSGGWRDRDGGGRRVDRHRGRAGARVSDDEQGSRSGRPDVQRPLHRAAPSGCSCRSAPWASVLRSPARTSPTCCSRARAARAREIAIRVSLGATRAHRPSGADRAF